MAPRRHVVQLDLFETPRDVPTREWFERWVRHRALDGRVLRASSIATYASWWSIFVRWFESHESCQLDATAIEAFLVSIEVGSLVRKRYQSLLRMVFDYSVDAGLLVTNPIVKLRSEGPRPELDSDVAEIERELANVTAQPPAGSAWREFRNWALVDLVVRGGVDHAVATRLRVQDVGLHARSIALGSRRVDIGVAHQSLRAWLRIRAKSRVRGDLVFGKRNGSALTASALFRAIQSYMARRGVRVKRSGFRFLRHVNRRIAKQLSNTLSH